MQTHYLSEGEIRQTIDYGAWICMKIKQICPDQTWFQIAAHFTRVKKRAREYFPNLKDLELLKSIHLNFSIQDLEEAINAGNTFQRTSDNQKNAHDDAGRTTSRIIDQTGTISNQGSRINSSSEEIYCSQISS